MEKFGELDNNYRTCNKYTEERNWSVSTRHGKEYMARQAQKDCMRECAFYIWLQENQTGLYIHDWTRGCMCYKYVSIILYVKL